MSAFTSGTLRRGAVTMMRFEVLSGRNRTTSAPGAGEPARGLGAWRLARRRAAGRPASGAEARLGEDEPQELRQFLRLRVLQLEDLDHGVADGRDIELLDQLPQEPDVVGEVGDDELVAVL